MTVLIGTDNADDVLKGTGADDTLYGQNGNDTLLGGAGNDYLWGGNGADTLDGGEGTRDSAVYYYSTSGVNVSLASGTGSGGEAQGDTLVNIENLIGSNYGDVLTGNDGDNTFDGWDGNDIINGGGGTDWLFGGGGQDTLNGGEGQDFLYGGDGNDTLKGTGGADWLTGGAGADTLIGGIGDDFYFVTDNLDTIQEGADEGFDAVYASLNYTLPAGVHVEILRPDDGYATVPINLTGNEFDNIVYGNDGSNALAGGAGNDTLIGRYGMDSLTGGTGADTFVWQTIIDSGVVGGSVDVVTDFNRAEGDLIDLAGIDADIAAAGDQAFTSVQVGGVFTAPGQIIVQNNGVDTFLLLNTNADGLADMIIQVQGLHAFDASWFAL
jgi:Ca2+-binding RTX toxin-like protein